MVIHMVYVEGSRQLFWFLILIKGENQPQNLFSTQTHDAKFPRFLPLFLLQGRYGAQVLLY